ncbi:hypothetical protein EV660_11178, partial [Roseinatronobacter bogoriensis DSM 18756]
MLQQERCQAGFGRLSVWKRSSCSGVVLLIPWKLRLPAYAVC